MLTNCALVVVGPGLRLLVTTPLGGVDEQPLFGV
jgi:hypothetical protein